MKDALGNDIVIGQNYGYSSGASGWVDSVVGEAVGETQERVTLRVIRRHTFLYGKPAEASWRGGKPAVSVKPCILFPVVDAQAITEAGRQNTIKILNKMIEEYRGGGEMKSMAESIHDDRFADELERLKKRL